MPDLCASALVRQKTRANLVRAAAETMPGDRAQPSAAQRQYRNSAQAIVSHPQGQQFRSSFYEPENGRANGISRPSLPFRARSTA